MQNSGCDALYPFFKKGQQRNGQSSHRRQAYGQVDWEDAIAVFLRPFANVRSERVGIEGGSELENAADFARHSHGRSPFEGAVKPGSVKQISLAGQWNISRHKTIS